MERHDSRCFEATNIKLFQPATNGVSLVSQSVKSAASFLLSEPITGCWLPGIMLRCCVKSSAVRETNHGSFLRARFVMESKLVTRFQGMSTYVLYHCAYNSFLKRRSIQTCFLEGKERKLGVGHDHLATSSLRFSSSTSLFSSTRGSPMQMPGTRSSEL